VHTSTSEHVWHALLQPAQALVLPDGYVPEGQLAPGTQLVPRRYRSRAASQAVHWLGWGPSQWVHEDEQAAQEVPLTAYEPLGQELGQAPSKRKPLAQAVQAPGCPDEQLAQFASAQGSHRPSCALANVPDGQPLALKQLPAA
jgi:hypothetical protein